MTEIAWLDSNNVDFPPIHLALDEPNGLLAGGGDLSPERLVAAYSAGIFPWYEDNQPLLWWSPDPRAVMYPDKMKPSRSLRKRLVRGDFEVRLNTNFAAVIEACAQPRLVSDETWITHDMQSAYISLHNQGLAHSIECYQSGELVGGLYGVSLGRLFFGESMFHTITDASKVAFVYLCRLMQDNNCPLIDCQMENPHLSSLGCELISRESFQDYLGEFTSEENAIDWRNLPANLPNWLSDL